MRAAAPARPPRRERRPARPRQCPARAHLLAVHAAQRVGQPVVRVDRLDHQALDAQRARQTLVRRRQVLQRVERVEVLHVVWQRGAAASLARPLRLHQVAVVLQLLPQALRHEAAHQLGLAGAGAVLLHLRRAGGPGRVGARSGRGGGGAAP